MSINYKNRLTQFADNSKMENIKVFNQKVKITNYFIGGIFIGHHMV